MKFDDGFDIAVAICCTVGIIVTMQSCSSVMDRWAATEECKKLNYSGGHYEKKAGLVCEQWIEAAKLRSVVR